MRFQHGKGGFFITIDVDALADEKLQSLRDYQLQTCLGLEDFSIWLVGWVAPVAGARPALYRLRSGVAGAQGPGTQFVMQLFVQAPPSRKASQVLQPLGDAYCA